MDEYYSSFLELLRNLLDNTTDNSTYEDSLREMFGIQAYIAFTMDKILQNCVKQVKRRDEFAVRARRVASLASRARH